MPFLPYVLVMIVAVGSVLLGVEVVTSPPRKPAMEVTSPANKLAQHETDRRAEKTEGDLSRPLTPLYPAAPGGAKDVRVVYPPSNQAAANQTTGPAPAEEPKLQSNSEPKAETASETKTEPNTEPKAEFKAAPKIDVASTVNNDATVPQPPQKPEPVKGREQVVSKPVQAAVHSPNHCDVQACASAYSSFHPADCSYQPFEGPRRACIAPPAQRSAENVRREEAAPARTKVRNEVVLRPPEPENAAMDEDDDDDAAGFMRGRRVIILNRNYRPY